MRTHQIAVLANHLNEHEVTWCIAYEVDNLVLVRALRGDLVFKQRPYP